MPLNTVKCPMCFKSFSSDFVVLHAQKCKGENVDTRSNTEDNEMPPPKKVKIFGSPGASVSPKCKSQRTVNPRFSSNNKNTANATAAIDNIKSQACASPNSSMKHDKMSAIPLAERCRPVDYDEYVGQENVLGKNSILSGLLKSNMIPSMILWGPPGCGKTSLAHVIARQTKSNKNSARFVKLSATNSGKADIQSAVEAAKNDCRMFQRKTILFIDEIHRFNKLQQDTFLPHVENGTIILLGATTENPSFSLNSALLSRCRVIVLDKLSTEDVKKILIRSIEKIETDLSIKWKGDTTCSNSKECYNSKSNPANDTVFASRVSITEQAIDFLAGICDGDARTALNGLQMAIQAAKSYQCMNNGKGFEIDIECVKKSLHRSHILYDRTGDQHYEMISAFQKSIRGSDDNATLYWLTRMLEGGEDPKYIARRMTRIASEDIGIADSNALNLAVSAQQACQLIGMPECDVVLAHCAVYLARAPKSAEVYMALRSVREKIQSCQGPLPGVPLHLRNASTKLMKELGYGQGYQYKPSPGISQTYLPDDLLNYNFFNNKE